MHRTDPESRRRNQIVLVALDHMKPDLPAWAAYDRQVLARRSPLGDDPGEATSTIEPVAR